MPINKIFKEEDKLLTASTRGVQDVLSNMFDKDLYILCYDNFHRGLPEPVKYINN